MLKPMNGHLLVQIVEKEARTASGIYIPSTASANEPKRARVLAVADDTTDYAYGDVVLFTTYSSVEVRAPLDPNNEQSVKALLVRAEDILAKEV